MAEGRSRESWAIASSVIANLANAIPFRSRAVQPAAFNPWSTTKSDAVLRAPLSLLCSVVLAKEGHKPLPMSRTASQAPTPEKR